jgi:hypothetical protein
LPVVLPAGYQLSVKKTSCIEFSRSVSAVLVAQLVLTGLVTHFTPLGARPLVMFASTAFSTVAITAWLSVPRIRQVMAISLSTVISTLCISAWRRMVDPLGFIGPVPASLEFPALGISAVLTIVSGATVAIASDRRSRAYRFRWAFVGFFSIVFAGGVFALSTGSQRIWPSIATRLQRVSQLEANLDSLGPAERQELSFCLCAFGRGSEAQAFSTWSLKPHRLDKPSRDKPSRDKPSHDKRATDVPDAWEKGVSSRAVAWRPAISRIAARERIVIIMEAHNATQHREWIEQTLPIFHKAGFGFYAAEALGESGDALKQRGFPLERTGYYVADPRFGNLLRRAIELDYSIHEYEALLASEIPKREEQQAQTLARIIAAHPGCKMLIHVGYGHAYKQPVPGTGKWMAARLWEKTGIEPYCIYQAHDDYDSPNYPRLVELAGATDEPKMLIPPPARLPDLQFAGIPPGAIDALVIHPLSNGKPPASRKPVFSSGRTQISGRWLQNEWPVVVGAYRTGEPVDAIALDQVMLRPGESAFELWVPSQAYELRVTSTSGIVEIDMERDGTNVRLRRSAASHQYRRSELGAKFCRACCACRVRVARRQVLEKWHAQHPRGD